jgi:gliding motility-associated-like protein
MKNNYKTAIFNLGILLMLIIPSVITAQQTDSVYINKTDSVFISNVSTQDTISIFGNIEHNGVMGTTKGAYIYFFGNTWKNTPTSFFQNFTANNPLATPSDGGIFSIKAKSNFAQIVKGGYNKNLLSGPVFPNMEIDNPYNVYLDSTDAAVMNTVKMDTGLVYLYHNTNNSVVLGGGSLKPQVINYTRSKFFVTGTRLIQDTSFVYVRNVIAGDSSVFPVGSKAGDFTPAGLTNKSSATDYAVRVFDGVYKNGSSGTQMTDTTFIQKTWYVNAPNLLQPAYSLNLQHHLTNETAAFGNNRASTFISIYDATKGWDTLSPINPFTTASIYPNIGNDGDSVFYHWRILDNIINPNAGNYFTKRYVAQSISQSLVYVKNMVALPEPLSDGTFNIVYKFTVINPNTNASLTQINLSDNLIRTFPSPAIFSVKSTYAVNGILIPNPSFDGSIDTMMVKNGTLAANASDTIYLLVNLNLNNTSDTTFANFGLGSYTDINGQTVKTKSTIASANIKPLDVFIPDGFSPNGDGINDKFVIVHGANKLISLMVYNRWGNIVFQNQTYQNEWDGKGVNNFLGKDLEAGTYYVIVTIKDVITGTEQKVTKSITLRRSY